VGGQDGAHATSPESGPGAQDALKSPRVPGETTPERGPRSAERNRKAPAGPGTFGCSVKGARSVSSIALFAVAQSVQPDTKSAPPRTAFAADSYLYRSGL